MKLIGDPHLGREFKLNVPLDRRGEREQMMFDQFEKELNDATDELLVIVGDLFEHWTIPLPYVYETLRLLTNWAAINQDKNLVILAGNHDISPDKAVVGAFDILEVGLEPYTNISVLRRPEALYGVAFFPWEWERSALEQIDDIRDWTNIDTAVGHWDLQSYGDSTFHLCPARQLRDKGVETIHSGHWHIAGDYIVDSVPVHCTGSMQPMTHAEDPEGKLYVTLTEEEYGRTDPSSLHDKYVRVFTTTGSEIVPPPTCLGFKTQKKDSAEPKERERVNLDNFDMKKILNETLVEHQVPDPIQVRIKGRLNDLA